VSYLKNFPPLGGSNNQNSISVSSFVKSCYAFFEKFFLAKREKKVGKRKKEKIFQKTRPLRGQSPTQWRGLDKLRGLRILI